MSSRRLTSKEINRISSQVKNITGHLYSNLRKQRENIESFVSAIENVNEDVYNVDNTFRSSIERQRTPRTLLIIICLAIVIVVGTILVIIIF